MIPEERFERIEAKHEQLTDLVKQITEGHIELGAAQLNQQKAHTRLEEVVTDLGECITNLTFLVDRSGARDFER